MARTISTRPKYTFGRRHAGIRHHASAGEIPGRTWLPAAIVTLVALLVRVRAGAAGHDLADAKDRSQDVRVLVPVEVDLDRISARELDRDVPRRAGYRVEITRHSDP